MRTALVGLAATLIATGAVAQTAPTTNPQSMNQSGTAAPATATPPAASAANDARPAEGANSFTRGQAATRIASHGYMHVTNLKLDQRGVWRGQATKDGRPVNVWLDYRGDVGQS